MVEKLCCAHSWRARGAQHRAVDSTASNGVSPCAAAAYEPMLALACESCYARLHPMYVFKSMCVARAVAICMRMADVMKTAAPAVHPQRPGTAAAATQGQHSDCAQVLWPTAP